MRYATPQVQIIMNTGKSIQRSQSVKISANADNKIETLHEADFNLDNLFAV